jgi:predicted acetyltransferase
VDEDRTPLGFALTLQDERGRSHVEEFFVLAGVRRCGLGTRAARLLFATRPGPWTFTVRFENPGALEFWQRVVPAAARQEIEVDDEGVARTRFSFDAP